MLNDDPTAIIGKLLSVLFLIYILYQFCAGMFNPEKHAFKKSPDNFDLGYITKRANPGVPTHLLPKPVKQLEFPTINPHVYDEDVCKGDVIVQKAKKKKKEYKKQPVSPIYNDCVLALRALGHSAKEAKEITTSYMSNNEVTSVEDFLRDAFRV